MTHALLLSAIAAALNGDRQLARGLGLGALALAGAAWVAAISDGVNETD